MDKTEFLRRFASEDKTIFSNIYDKIKLAQKTGKKIYCNEFYTPNIWSTMVKSINGLEIKIDADGIFSDSERKMLAFSNEATDSDFPYELIKIENLSRFEQLSHGDYLGAVMSLGLNRNKFGDLVLGENCAYIATCIDVAAFLVSNLSTIKRSPCKTTIINVTEESSLKANYEELNVISTSLRLDCVVSGICKLSRSKALDLINTSKISVDYITIKEKNYMLSIGDTITIRGYGKYKFEENIGFTGRDRMRLLMKKFV